MKATKLLPIIAAIIIASLFLISLASALTITSVNSNPQFVQPGEKISLDLTLKNNLNDDVIDVTISLDLSKVPFSPYQDSSERNFDEIIEDKSKDISFDLIAFSNAASGTYLIPVQIDYTLTDNETKAEDTGLISVIVNAKPKIDISVEGSLIKGQAGKVTIKVVNSGLGNARFLTTSLLQTSGLQLTSPASVYIGNIDSNDFDSADFNVFINQNSPSTIILPVQVTYSDSQNNQITDNENIPVRVYSLQEAKQLGLVSTSKVFVYIVLIIIAIILYFVYRSVRRRLKNRKLQQE